jgi:hypothetical protein
MTSTTLTTILGQVQAVGTGVVDYAVHTPMEGGALKQPTFWLGLIIAICMSLKAYYTQGTAPAGQTTATVPVGTVPVTKVAPPPAA